MPPSSRMDLPLAKAKPIRNDSNISVITYLRKDGVGEGQNCGSDEYCSQRRAECEHVNNSADTKVSGKGGAGGAPGTRAKVLLQPMVQPMVRQLCPCSPWRTIGVQRSTCSLQ
ncbi:protein pxr1-like [Willisornis vidua]|uniref:Protein pxr1-like n=1 Tax=Willisornis vidua TaxID=1566151 RepID=A0ABQ9CRL9_9PASS|nr:protein pxr1-like [Willisornis vidua]